MTVKDAIKYWEFKYNQTKNYNDEHWEASERREHREYVEALKVAIESLEKQIPVEVGLDVYGCYIYNCPVCNNPISKRHKYCSECGKTLTWKKRIQGELKNETKT